MAVAGDESGGEVPKEERKLEGVVYVEGGEDVEIVLSLIAADEQGLGFDDGVGAVDIGMGCGDLGVDVWIDVLVDEEGDAEDREGDEDWGEEIAAFGLGEGQGGHLERVKGKRERVKSIAMGDGISRAFDCVFLEQDGDEGGGGDSDQGSDDACQGGA